MFEQLSESIQHAIRGIRGTDRVSDINIASALKEIRRALVAADVDYKLAKGLTEEIKQQAIGEHIKLSVSPGQYFTKLTLEALTRLMGQEAVPLSTSARPSIVLVTGLQGSGKTTFCAKLALRLKKQGLQTALVACDLYRPAAIEQLRVLGERIGITVYADTENKDTVAVARSAVAKATADRATAIVVDTAGRLAIDEQMMEELSLLKQALRPKETLYVLDSMMGQDAVNTASTFIKRIDFDGVALTKLDGDTRGGCALSVRASTERPIKFISTGEDLDSLDVFHPERMAQRILGMGDVLSLVEKAQEQFDKKESDRLARKLKRNTFDLEDFLNQIQRLKKMGKFKDLVGMIPGMGKQVAALDEKDAFKQPEAIILSMTPEERRNPQLIKQSRKLRISKGSGTGISEINHLLKGYDVMRKVMRKAGKGQNLLGDTMDKKAMGDEALKQGVDWTQKKLL